MNVAGMAVGCILMALALVMAANRSGYVHFIVGPRSVLVLAGAIAVAALRSGFFARRNDIGLSTVPGLRFAGDPDRPVKPAGPMLYVRRPAGP